MIAPDFTNNAPAWQVVSQDQDDNIKQIIITEDEDEAYKVYSVVKETYDVNCKHFLIQNGFVIRNYIPARI